MPIPDPNFVASVPLQYIFLNKDDGEPLSSGVVSFYSDPDFSVPKTVYQLTLNPDNSITFAPLSNPLILSGIGTFVDGTGNNLVPYYFPFDGTPGSTNPGNFQPYFITVYSSDGVFQFSLQEWPPNSLSDSGGTSTSSTQNSSIITNPQFTQTIFNVDPASGVASFAVTGTETRNSIAPGWEIVTSGAGTVSVSQLSIGDSIPTEATTALEITTAGGITDVKLVQRLEHDPRLLSNPTGTSYISGYLVARSAISTTVPIIMSYAPSGVGSATTTIFSGATGATHQFAAISGTAPISTPLSGANADGYVDIIIDIGALTTVAITSVQVLGVESDATIPGYAQSSTQKQLSDMSWYYNPQWSFKPIKSYLVGWDFPLNPAQALGYAVSVKAVGTNKGFYAWDQTIVFQSVDSAVSVAQGTSGEIVLTAAIATKMGLIQYLDAFTAKKILLQQLSVNVLAKASAAVTATVSLWYTTSTLPTLPNTLVTTLDANGYPSAVAAGWAEVPRTLPGNAVFSIGASAVDFGSYGLSGWDLDDTALAASATFFAIVVGTGTVALNGTVSFESISLVPGQIPTIPAPQTLNEVLSDCQRYYQKSFVQGVVPAENLGLGNGETYGNQNVASTAPGAGRFPVNFAVPMYAAPSVTLFNPNTVGATGQIYNETSAASWSACSAAAANKFTKNNFLAIGTVVGDAAATIAVNWTADARLGTY